MRTDCTRDNRKTHLPNADTLGYGRYFAKRGNWVSFSQNGDPSVTYHGRVIGGVTCEGRRYVEVIALLGALDNPAVRWLAPHEITRCDDTPPAGIFSFICGEWIDPARIIGAAENGFTQEMRNNADFAAHSLTGFYSDKGTKHGT